MAVDQSVRSTESTFDQQTKEHVQSGVAGELNDDSIVHSDTNFNGKSSENPALRLTADDGTETELDDVKNAELASGELVRAMTGLENDLSAVRSAIQSKTPSDVQTIVIDHGDTAQLQQQDQNAQVPIPASPGNDLAGIGGTLREGEMEVDTHLELSDTESEEADNLWSLLDDNLITPPPHDGKKFLPLNELRRIIAKPKVHRALRSSFSNDKAFEYANAVCNRTSYNNNQQTTRQRMFAILVLTENIGALPSLIDEDLHDAHLPFEADRDEGKKKWYLYRKGENGTRIRFEGSLKWKNPKIKLFHEKQWLFLSPFFNMLANKPLAYPLEPMVILPFLEGAEGQHDTVYGGYSSVWRVKIHHAHHNYTHRAEPYFAIKKLLSIDEPAFNQELQALKTFNLEGHEHLTKLLATYEYHGHRFFLFPWADGNLREFWERFQRPKPSYLLVKWIAKQSAGLASGLELIQHPPRDTMKVEDPKNFGRHGDLKPENVLWFKDSDQLQNMPGNGTLKITDFGLTRFHRDITKSKDNARGLGVSLTYKAPEVDVVDRVSQAYDLWTMGLLLLEFVTWYLKGWEGVDEFSKNRSKDDKGNEFSMDTFYNLETQNGRTVATLKPSVKEGQWTQKLHKDSNCSLFLHALITYISHHLIRVDRNERHTSREVAQKLRDMAGKCARDSQYAWRGCPKPPNKSDTARTDNTVSDDGYGGVDRREAVDSCHPSPEICGHDLSKPDPMEDVVALDDLLEDTPTHNRRVLANGSDIMPPPRSNSAQQALHEENTDPKESIKLFTSTLTDSPPPSPQFTSQASTITENSDEGRFTLKRGRFDYFDNSLGRELKQPKLHANGMVLNGQDPDHLRHMQ
ncbi:dual specificity tyrosine-phosphorylation-regulated kinase mbk-2 [Colletotrichum spaethianum]|uniref:Dual specificity tyrosine-phosphorylation-regulated kinase mbk-2 n=1 Tax=Colletotrichum spaethianum TaxID=700344 RepID=A0AA37URL7_9PEZI|nr:dual specificity tyrosine-phosphorylation-regulated kinase mbk-2 [Colletotrichum spaethianum]GKT51017.1 dual specificity tyrosine-phosphorylation-regulated kinase mbk-2 [Colletotrichum spaethianum]